MTVLLGSNGPWLSGPAAYAFVGVVALVVLVVVYRLWVMKKCPHCRKRINMTASVCRFCGSDQFD